jgi:hypothetical protein
MCTLTWLALADGYELFCNRDELHTRPPASPPEVASHRGVRYLAPTDGQAGGTWVGVNELGLGLCLLNAWRAALPEPPEGFESRGTLVRGLFDARSQADVSERLRADDLARYPGFRLTVFEPGRDPRLFAHTSRDLVEERAEPPIVSSSLDRERAFAERREVLERLRAESGGADAALLAAYHASHLPERGPWSVCMHRDDAATVSATHVRVDRERIELRYAPGPPCTTPFGETLGFARAPAGAGRTAGADRAR